MKVVKESLNEFERGQDPKAALGIGIYKKISTKLKELYDRKFQYYNYKIISLNNIEISYNEEYIKDDPKFFGVKYILEYIELPQFTLNNYKNSYTLYDHKFNDNNLSIYKNNIYFSDNPTNENVEQELVFHIGKYNDEKVTKMGEIILDALNKNYPPVWGFKLKEIIKPNETN